MNHEDFNKIIEDTFSEITNLSKSKAKEYASDGDRFENFKHYGKVFNCTPERSLLNVWGKHLVSLLDMIKWLENGKHCGLEMWNEKIKDTILYMVLLKALLIERYDKNENNIGPENIAYTTSSTTTDVGNYYIGQEC